MKKIILILCLFFLFSTSLLAEEDVCDWIITGGNYQEYLDDLPSSDFHSAFHVVVGNDGRCSYGWDWWETNRPLEDVIQDSFNDCEEWRKKENIDGGECKPYDINAKIVWGKPDLYEELTGSKMKTSEEMIAAIAASSEEVCDWIFNKGYYQEYLDDLPPSDFDSAFYIAVGTNIDGNKDCTYAWRRDNDRLLVDVSRKTKADCDKYKLEFKIEGECRPYDINAKIVWGKPELYKELIESSNKATKMCDFIMTNNRYKDYLGEIDSFPDHNFVFWVLADVDDGWCDFGGRTFGKNELIDVIKSGYLDCEKGKHQNARGECTPFALNKKIVWNKPELYAELTGSKLKPSEEIQKSMDEGDYDSVDVGMWQLDGIINSKDPSTLQKVIYIGDEKRNILEARADREDKSRRFLFKATPYVYDAYYENGKIFEILIYFKNEKKKSKGKAESLAEKYAFMIGQMPNVLLQRLDAAHIYADVPGISNASAHTRVINIHPKGEGGYVHGTAIEELFIHELVHASLDKPIHGGVYKRVNKKRHENTTIKSKKLNWGDWRKAVKKDKKKYITEYAKTTIHEDLAESFTAWLALRYKGDRISDLQKQAIENRIPNRIKFFDEQQFDMHPLVLNN